MLRPPPVPLPLRLPAPRASALPLPRAANPNTDPTTTTTAGTAATMGAAAWWRRTLGQRFNPAGVAAVVAVAASEPRLALPHVSVQDIRWLDWAELRRAGFRGVVFEGQHPHRALRSRNLVAARRRVRPVPRDVPARCARHLQ
ncbi:hypothetical protein PR202_ga09375 [Eleusine coracana subsp. coracana]|uniref:Uncharacterized protein n=1 Tax=Eleusine coracana subsp. coracana TaxID=191504 RepID=A0AAV5C445_ELECO|nr:hypothetical protein PR202_ga09375 [Eleusine coracana subsp. coracana]